ncbi:ATP-binding protein [Spirulina sp. CS-785/01]|uniref:sensor histidine kinase n=1 Tax=Spirulina sp. CS-785/01 TaxID=3021716 RepID=UPI00232FEA6D|nr:ATP-binding protein [Spirulina sp. CS-785/01]MDB9311573.1 ATP-binding protein [Spirulina sp. CS-785/01]
MLNLNQKTYSSTSPYGSPFDFFAKKKLTPESTLNELELFDFQVEDSTIVMEVAQVLDRNPILPGVILVHNNEFSGMISRRRFLERMSRPYALELFLKRSVKSLYDFTKAHLEVFPETMTIVEATRRVLERPPEFLYEPIIVQLDSGMYRIADIHHLFLAQSHIHQVTSQLLDESTYAQRVQTEKMVSLGRMVAGVAHEIRNPVNSVSGNIDFLTDYYENLLELLEIYQESLGKKNKKVQDFEEEIDYEFILEDCPKILKSIKIGAERLIQIVTSLRNFSRMDDREKQLIDLHECIDGTLLILENRLKHGITVKKEYNELPPMTCYSGQLSQVFMNLIANSVDTLNERQEQEKESNWKPKITIKTNLLDSDSSTKAVSIKIGDNGLGISKDIQEKIFENFFTTKPVGKGTGLGLAISYQIITEKHNGQLKMDSEVGVGTEFEIILPLEKTELN